MSEQRDDALDEDALEASTVIERRTDAGAAGPVRLSPLQPLARVDIPVIRTPVAPEVSIVLPEAEPPPAEPPPPALLLRSGSAPARPLADPWPTGSARRSQATRPRPAVRTGDGRRLLLVGVLAFGGGVLVRHLWPRAQVPASLPETVAPAGGPPAQLAAPALAPAPSTAPTPAARRPTPGPKRKHRRGF